MSPIPGEPLTPKPHEVTLKDGRKVKVKLPGLAPRVKPTGTGERVPPQPPRDDPRPAHNENHVPGF